MQTKGSRTTLRPEKDRSAAKTPSPARRQGHVKSATVHGALPDLANPSFFSIDPTESTGVTTPAKSTVKKSPSTRGGHGKTPSKAASISSNDAPWDTWDDNPSGSPKASTRSDSSGASSDATTLPPTVSGSPRPSVDSNKDLGKKDKDQAPIPWPALSKFGPATLRRTASHLMNEWEKSLTPSPGKEFVGQGQGGDYLGMGAEAAAMGSGGGAGGRKGS